MHHLVAFSLICRSNRINFLDSGMNPDRPYSRLFHICKTKLGSSDYRIFLL